eukprot:4100325-Pyramimonas_sp.AAC.1
MPVALVKSTDSHIQATLCGHSFASSQRHSKSVEYHASAGDICLWHFQTSALMRACTFGAHLRGTPPTPVAFGTAGSHSQSGKVSFGDHFDGFAARFGPAGVLVEVA